MFKCWPSVVCILVCVILLVLTKDTVETHEIRHPAPEFSRHRVVTPTVHHGRTKREISSTKHTDGIHHREVTVTVDLDKPLVLDLRLNEDLVAGDHVVRYQKDGKTVIHRPTVEELDICQYSGTVRGARGSSVAVSTCHGLRGVINDGRDVYYIEPTQGSLDSEHYVYSHSDLGTEYHCGYVGGVTNNTKYDPELMKQHLEKVGREKSRISRYKRDTSEDTMVRGPFNANKLSRYVELVLVADHREYLANGESMDTVHRQLKDVANIINSVYAPLNIFIALVGVVVWSERDEIVLEEDGDKTLTHFLQYRREVLVRDIPNDNAHLLTRQQFNSGVVGKALKGPICTYQFSGGVATNHSQVIGLVATTIAHEMGHNFGMEHDTEADCTCPDDKCIMSPSSTSVVPTHWSSCSLSSLALAFEKGMDYCLRNKPKRLFESPTCGNGFVEAGEQCDCGLRPFPACTACCDPIACLLRRNATCAVGECCDPQTCRPKSAGTVCRSADKECDLPEFCTGHSEFCPRDVFKMDATPCGNNQAYCVQGSCRSHFEQCRLLWGSTAANSDYLCYNNSNVVGDRSGHCGYIRGDPPQYKRCAPADALCGLLQCQHLNEQLEFGMESVSVLSAKFINHNPTTLPSGRGKGKLLVCRTAIVDLGQSDPDPGMVPDGAKCGEDMMCLKQRCVPVEMVTSGVGRKEGSVCPSNCSGHGVCNSEGHCHCEVGFSPPLCAAPGPGGSYDSGPASDASIQRNFMVAMYVIFLGILPCILLVLFLLYYVRHNVPFWWKKPRKTYVHNPCNWFTWDVKPPIGCCVCIPLVFKAGRDACPVFKSNKEKETSVDDKEENIYESVEDHDYASIKSEVDLTKVNKVSKISWFKFKFVRKETKVPTKLPTSIKVKRKINKDDIQVGVDISTINVENVTLYNADIRKGTGAPKKKTNLDIVNKGLAFTTNENINKAVSTNTSKSTNSNNIDKNDYANLQKKKVSKNNFTSAHTSQSVLNQRDKIINNIKDIKNKKVESKNSTTNKNIKNNVKLHIQPNNVGNTKVNNLIAKFEKK